MYMYTVVIVIHDQCSVDHYNYFKACNIEFAECDEKNEVTDINSHTCLYSCGYCCFNGSLSC